MARNIPRLKSKGLQPRLLYPERLSIKMESEIRNFPDKRRLKVYTSTKPALQEMLKGLLLEVEEKRKKTAEVQRGIMTMSKYLSIRTLNINGLNASIKRYGIAEWIRKHDPQNAAYKTPTSGQKTYTD